MLPPSKIPPRREGETLNPPKREKLSCLLGKNFGKNTQKQEKTVGKK
ncbi:MAG: hypothetical protein RL757_2797 [Bacteroidota bacterium]|jgi:hypothetical protein